MLIDCPDCDGTGVMDGDCLNANSTNEASWTSGPQYEEVECERCDGEGRIEVDE